MFEKEGKPFDDLTSHDIISKGINEKDPLCMKVIEKFTKIFAVEAANLALKTLPYGGIYLIGGVTAGIRDYILNTDTFIKNFEQKGRLEPAMKKIPLYLVDPMLEVGLMGAEEVAYRLIKEVYSQN